MKRAMTFICMAAAILAFTHVHAAPGCRAERWPYSRHQDNIELHQLFEKLGRAQLRNHLYAELTTPQQPSMAKPLLRYLIQTEADSLVRGYYETLRWAADLDKSDAASPRKLELSDICEIEKKLNDARK